MDNVPFTVVIPCHTFFELAFKMFAGAAYTLLTILFRIVFVEIRKQFLLLTYAARFSSIHM